jgi:hypothetical protein
MFVFSDYWLFPIYNQLSLFPLLVDRFHSKKQLNFFYSKLCQIKKGIIIDIVKKPSQPNNLKSYYLVLNFYQINKNIKIQTCDRLVIKTLITCQRTISFK